MNTWNGSPQRELTTNTLSGMLGADHLYVPLPTQVQQLALTMLGQVTGPGGTHLLG